MNPLAGHRLRGRKSLHFSLSVLLFFASYRPATCLISLASLSSGGTGGTGLMQPPKERPRPTRQQSLTRIDRVAGIRALGIQPKPDRPSSAEETSREVSAHRSPEGSAGSRARTALIQPDYLRPSVPDSPTATLPPPL